MFSTDPNSLPHKERKSLPPEVVEEAFRLLAEEDARREKQRKMNQQLSKQRRKSRKLCKIAKKDCWSDDEIESSGNDAQVQLNNMKIPYQLRCRSSMQCVRGKAPNFDIVALLKEESGVEEIILCKVIDESHTGSVELTNLDPCGNDPILYTIGTSGTWTRSIDDVFPVLMVYADDSDKLMLNHPSLSEIISQLSSRSYEYRSTAVIKRGFYMGYRSDVTPLLGDDHFIKIGRKKFIQMDGLLVHNTNPYDFTIKVGMYARIYYENLPGISEEESLKIPYPVEVLNCLVDVSTGGTFCWVRIFECELDVIGRGHHIPQGVNLHPHEVFYTKQGLLISTEIIYGIVDVFFTASSIKRWGNSTQKGESFFCRFIAMKDDKHTTFQLLATKGDDEVVTARLAASTKYGTHNALPSCIGVLQPHRIHRHNIHLLSYKVFNHIRARNMIRSESFVEIPCLDKSFMVTFEIIAMHAVPPGIVKKNNSLEFTIEGYVNLKEAVFYTWSTFPDRYQLSSGSSNDSQPVGKWRAGPTFRFRYLYSSLQPCVQVHFSWDSHQWDPVHQCYGLGMRTGATHLEI